MKKKISLKELIVEQSVFDSIKSIFTPMRNAISQIGEDIPDNKIDAERSAEWDEIKTEIDKFFDDFPQTVPKTEQELNQFEDWIKKNRSRLTRNNAKQLLAKAFLGKNVNVNFAQQIQDMLKKLVMSYSDKSGDVFTQMRADDLEKIVKRALEESKGNIEKAKHYLLKLMLDNFNKISKLKLGVDYRGKKGVDDSIGFNSDLIGKALDLPADYVKSRIEQKIKDMQKLAGQEKEEELKLGPKGEELLTKVVNDYTKQFNADKENKQLLGQIRDIVIKTIKNNYYYNLEEPKDFDELMKLSLKNVIAKLKPEGQEQQQPEQAEETQKLLDAVISFYSKKRKLDTNDQNTMNKIKKVVEETINDNPTMDVDDNDEFKLLKQIALKKLFGIPEKQKTTKTPESELSTVQKEIVDTLMNNYQDWNRKKAEATTKELASKYNETDLTPGSDSMNELLKAIIQKMNE